MDRLLDDFAVRAMIGGIGVALATGPLGCFVVWRRMAYFGDSLAHSALLGIALGFLLAIDLTVGVAVTGAVLAIGIVFLQEQRRFATDTLLGLLSHSALALGLIAVGLIERLRVDLMGYLFGDLLAVSAQDIAWIYGGSLLVLAVLATIWRSMLAITVHDELARAEGINAIRTRLIFTLLLAMTVAVAMKIVGVLLVTSLLIMPAAAARSFATTPERMGVVAALIGALAAIGGVLGSLRWDTPSGPSVVITALGLFILGQIYDIIFRRRVFAGV